MRLVQEPHEEGRAPLSLFDEALNDSMLIIVDQVLGNRPERLGKGKGEGHGREAEESLRREG